jgi:hypothetical protein
VIVAILLDERGQRGGEPPSPHRLDLLADGHPDLKHVGKSQRSDALKTHDAANECVFKEDHAHAMALHFLYYNFVRIHQTLKVTPAMAAGDEAALGDW